VAYEVYTHANDLEQARECLSRLSADHEEFVGTELAWNLFSTCAEDDAVTI